MKKILYTAAVAVAVMAVSGTAAGTTPSPLKGHTADNATTVNRYGHVGLTNTHSAQTLGQGRFVFNIYGIHSGDKNYINDVYLVNRNGEYNTAANGFEVNKEFSKSTFNVAVGFGITSFLDMSFMAPVYIDWKKAVYFSPDPATAYHWQAGNKDKPNGGAGDATISMKVQFPFNSQKFFDMSAYGAVTLPTGHQTNGRFVRNTYYLDKDSVGVPVHYFSAGKGKSNIDMKMLWTWDFNEVASPFPMLLHVNYGIKFSTNPHNEHSFSLNAGAEVRPVDFLDLYLDFSSEPRMGSISQDTYNSPLLDEQGDSVVVTRGLKHDPLRLSPGLKFLLPGGFNLGAGADFSLANDYGLFQMQKDPAYDPIRQVDVDDVVIETAVEPKVSFVGSIGWNGFVIPQDADKDGIIDNLDNCPKEPEDFDGFMDTDGCPDLDNDNDSLPDADDKCPNVAGPVSNKGCPVEDRDGDGIKDADDVCPDVPGLTDFSGCPNPDRDGDRVLDAWVMEKGLVQKFSQYGSGVDKCPEEKGLLENAGCPLNDKDGDGIVDKEDDCPDLFGVAKFAGCPNPDRDADGIADPWVSELGMSARFAAIAKGFDKCPEQPENVNAFEDEDGCPDVKPEAPKAQEIQRGAMVLRGVNFETGKAILTRDSYDNLDKVVASLKEYPEVKIEVSGHTDNVGSSEANKRLSYNRAKAVMTYFIQSGISESRLRAVGMGMDAPVAENTTADGRALNRRVELKRID